MLACLLDQKLNDLDVTIDGVMGDDLAILPKAEQKNDVFDRSVYQYNGLHMDIWPLRESREASFARSNGLQMDIYGLLALVPFNLDKIAFEIRKEEIVDAGCLQGIRERTIVYDTPIEDGFYTHAARAFLLQQKTGYEFAPSTIALLEKASRGLAKDPTKWVQVENQLKAKHADLLERVREELMPVSGV